MMFILSLLRNKLAQGFIIVLSIAGGYYYYSNYITPIELPAPPAGKIENLEKIAKDLDLKILDSAKFKSLKINGENPVNPGITGKRNIFSPPK
jgi:hypothetical protein